MPSPAGYRTALRLFQLAERFGLPVVTLVDTCGAWPSFEVSPKHKTNSKSDAVFCGDGLYKQRVDRLPCVH